MKLAEILSVLPFYESINITNDIVIEAIEMDHREIKAGSLFVCLEGFTVDGHGYAHLAIENGAVAIIAEKSVGNIPTIIVPDTSRALAMIAAKFYDFPSKELPLIGITGTNGKTTITYLLEAIFNQYKQKTGLIGTIQMKIGDQSFAVKNTTPDALLLQRTLKQMVHENVDIAIMEVSSHALDLGRVHGCEYDIAIFTNLSQDHLDYHKNMAEYLRAKSLLFAQLGNSYNIDNEKFAVVNTDDPYSEVIMKSTAQNVITYGCKETAQVMADNIVLGIKETCFTLKTPIGSIDICSPLIGMFNVYNMLAASSTAIIRNIPLITIKEALESITGVDGRFEQVIEGQKFAVIVDYAHTPDSLENVLQTIKDFSEKKVYVVVGCGGDRDRTKRPLMAEIAMKYADQAIFTSDNPRTEDPQSILDEMTVGLEDSHYKVIVDRKEAIKHAVNLAKEEDIILIAGKGHETYQEVNQVKYDFDDRIVAKKAINKEI